MLTKPCSIGRGVSYRTNTAMTNLTTRNRVSEVISKVAIFSSVVADLVSKTLESQGLFYTPFYY
jgi:hypothetical protein